MFCFSGCQSEDQRFHHPCRTGFRFVSMLSISRVGLRAYKPLIPLLGTQTCLLCVTLTPPRRISMSIARYPKYHGLEIITPTSHSTCKKLYSTNVPRNCQSSNNSSQQSARGASIAIVLIWACILCTWVPVALYIHFIASYIVFVAIESTSALLGIIWFFLEADDRLYDLGQFSPSLSHIHGAYIHKRRATLEDLHEVARLTESSLTTTLYPKLEEGQMRLLVLEPGLQGDGINCRLHICHRSDMVSYQALSYAWGDATKVFEIQCNGHGVRVASNLYQALTNLRHSRLPRILWIDALCINQDDIEERGKQIQNMKSIYAAARQVVVWLGQSDRTSKRAFEYVLDNPSLAVSWDPIGLNPMLELHTSLGGDVWSLTRLLERPWFRRLWVLQEVAYGKKIILLTGSYAFRWEPFAQSVLRLFRSGSVLHGASEKAQAGAAAVIEMESFRQSQRSLQPGNSRSLLSVLLATHSGECSDPRDRIYAVLGLSDDYDSQRDSDDLKTDYSLHPRDLFIRFAQWYVKRGSLGFLSCTTRTSMGDRDKLGGESLPSWVPDWTNIDNDHPFARYPDRVPFQADNGLELLPHNPPKITEDNNLVIFGATVGVIQCVGQSSNFTKSSTDEGTKLIVSTAIANKMWLENCQKIGDQVARSSKKHFCRAITASLTGSGYAIRGDFDQRFQEYLEILNEISFLDDAKQQVSGLAVEIYTSQRYLTATMESSILMWASKRRFAVTQQGMMALVPNSAKPGDVIVVVAGSKVPLVFRETPHASGKYHIVLGEAFIDDLMDGRYVRGHVEDYKRLGKGYNRPLFKYFLLT